MSNSKHSQLLPILCLSLAAAAVAKDSCAAFLDLSGDKAKIDKGDCDKAIEFGGGTPTEQIFMVTHGGCSTGIHVEKTTEKKWHFSPVGGKPSCDVISVARSVGKDKVLQLKLQDKTPPYKHFAERNNTQRGRREL